MTKWITIAAALLVASPAVAQDVSTRLDDLFSWATPDAPGCVVGGSVDGAPVTTRAYGLARIEPRIPLTPTTAFDIGSVQKQFVAAAALLLVDEGRLSLDGDIREHLPELPDYGHTITLDHLLTHTSGIRDWIPLMNFSSGDEDALTLILRQRGLNFPPGEEWSYSNSNYVLAKEIIARTSGMSFADFVRTRIFEPLGMARSMYAADIRATENGAVAYEKEDDVWTPAMMLGDERGGGAVLSTVEDLLAWNDALSSGALGSFVTAKLQEPARLNNGRELTYARGLFVEDTGWGRAVWHTGSARAFGALLSRLPDHGLSIAMLCNAGDEVDRNLAGRRVADAFLPESVISAAEASRPSGGPAADAVEVDVSGRAGLFFGEGSGDPLRLVAQGGRLRIAPGPVLIAVANDRFRNPEGMLSFMSEAEFELRFLSPDVFELVTAEGETTRYHRAERYAPTAAELEAFAGRYESEDLGAVFEVAPGRNGVVLSLGSQTIPFEAVHTDTFQRGPFTVRFHRDEGGQVVALEFSNPVLRKVPFGRL